MNPRFKESMTLVPGAGHGEWFFLFLWTPTWKQLNNTCQLFQVLKFPLLVFSPLHNMRVSTSVQATSEGGRKTPRNQIKPVGLAHHLAASQLHQWCFIHPPPARPLSTDLQHQCAASFYLVTSQMDVRPISLLAILRCPSTCLNDFLLVMVNFKWNEKKLGGDLRHNEADYLVLMLLFVTFFFKLMFRERGRKS